MSEIKRQIQNMLNNPGFESGSSGIPSYWSEHKSGTTPSSPFTWPESGRIGGYSISINFGSSNNSGKASLMQNIPVKGNTSYILSGFMKLNNVTGTGARIGIDFYKGSQYQSRNSGPKVQKTGTIDWQSSPYNTTVISNTDSDNANIWIMLSNGSGKVYFDDMFFGSSVAQQTLTGITLPSTANVPVGKSTTLTAICYDQNGNVMTCPILNWSSSDTTIATVTSTGNNTASVNGIKIGTVAIKACYGTICSSCNLTVSSIYGNTIRVKLTRQANADYWKVSLNSVVTMDIEKDYLPCVVFPENGSDTTPVESLKVQAVISRTYAYWSKGWHSACPNDLTDSPNDSQSYSVSFYSQTSYTQNRILNAVNSTAGIVIKWGTDLTGSSIGNPGCVNVCANVPKRVICSAFVDGSSTSGTDCIPTYNIGKCGDGITQTSDMSATNPPCQSPWNRGALGQQQSNTLASGQNVTICGITYSNSIVYTYDKILRYFYGYDIIIEQMDDNSYMIKSTC